MIISGFTRREQVIDTCISDMTGQHSHCFLCRQVYCNHFVDNVTTCEMTTCPNCAWRFHACKSEEHTHTCQESRVACVNACNGCPHFVKRSQMAQHLPVCPASVVCCGEEWCRWPMHAREKGIRHSLPPSKTYIDCGQLDVGLAMRDQRMLIDSLKAPRKLKRSLRNPLTLKYPAAPLTHRSSSMEYDLRTSGDTSQTVSDDETDTPWDLNKMHPGLKASICSQLFKVTKETTDKLTTALNLASDLLTSKGNQEERESSVESIGAGSINCNPKENSDSNKESPVRGADREPVRSSVSSERLSNGSRSRSVSVLRDVGGTHLHEITGEKLVDGNDQEISLHKLLGVNLSYEVINKYVRKPVSMYTFICAQNFRRDEYKWHFQNIHEQIHQGVNNGWFEQRCPLAYLGCTFSFHRLIPEQPDVVLYHSWLQESYGLKSLAQPINFHGEKDISDQLQRQELQDSATTDEAQLQQTQQHQPSISDLGNFDKEFDSIPKMSIVHEDHSDARVGERTTSNRFSSCSDNESRDSEEREPMMTLRPVVFTASNADSKVLFQYDVEESQRNDSFASIPPLTGFPFEILQLIAKHLDSFSLCNLSLTCRRLREVCCSLLDDHGIVLLNWERHKIGDKVSWKVSNKRWIFSTSFEPVRRWKFNPNQPSVADHLKSCPFNQDCNTRHGRFKVVLT